MQTERTMPASVDAEKQILGAILMDETGFAYNQAVSAIKPDDLSLDSHRRIFSRMIELMEAGSPINFNTLTDCLGQYREIEQVGGVQYVLSLTDGMPRIKNIG
jgi:replicative DNA helicase